MRYANRVVPVVLAIVVGLGLSVDPQPNPRSSMYAVPYDVTFDFIPEADAKRRGGGGIRMSSRPPRVSSFRSPRPRPAATPRPRPRPAAAPAPPS